MSNNYKNYNPDILETIANLSNDEVFTPPEVAREMLDMLPKEVWSNSKLKFLDPALKTGIFLREITSRLIEGLAEEIPDLQERVNHILTKQVYGVGITQLTTLMSRRTLYCSKDANGPYSICTEFETAEGNILFPDTKHDFNEKTGRCEDCGANKESYESEEGRENHAYSFIHKDFEEVFGNMKFDVIIGNPPYQLDTGGMNSKASPIYDLFVEKSLKLNPKYISMIIPSRWMKGGKGLKSFRINMMNDKRIKYIYDYQNSETLFPSVHIDGGICYFLWDKNHNGKVKYYYTDHKDIQTISERNLKVDFYDKIIRDNRQLSIVSKVKKKTKKNFSKIVGTSGGSFGFHTYLFNEPERYSEIKLSDIPKENYSLIHGVLGQAGGSKRVSKYINNESIKRGLESVDKYKLFFSKAFSQDSTTPPEMIEGEPGHISTATFLKIGDFETKEEMLNCKKYMETKFFRALFFINRSSFLTTVETFSLIPLQDWGKSWTDADLYKKYKLTQEEIDYIEDNIAEME